MDINVSCICDPLEVIIKLSILSNKKGNYKLSFRNNKLFLNESNICNSLKRTLYGDSYLDLQYLYIPIELACIRYLNRDTLRLFESAQKAIIKLIETYNNRNLIIMLLKNIYTLIESHIEVLLSKPEKSKVLKYSTNATFDFKVFDDIKKNIEKTVKILPRSDFDKKLLEYYNKNESSYIKRWECIKIHKIVELLDNIDIFETYINNL